MESRALGGTCVNVGCVPKKIMWFAASHAHHLNIAGDFGFDVTNNGHDWEALVEGRDRHIQGILDWYDTFLKDLNIAHLRGHATFIDSHTIEVSGERYTADHILIATGGKPFVLPVPGAELGITSDGFFELRERPAHVCIIGGGYIGVELAGVLSALGSGVCLTMRTHDEDFLPQFDCTLREVLMEEMVKAGIRIEPGNSSIDSLERQPDGTIAMNWGNGRKLQGFDQVIWAVGRSPNTEALGRLIYTDYIYLFQAAGLVLAHNHPNGNVQPSQHDKLVTRAIVLAAETVGLRVVDHLIVSKEAAFSFREQGLL